MKKQKALIEFRTLKKYCKLNMGSIAVCGKKGNRFRLACHASDCPLWTRLVKVGEHECVFDGITCWQEKRR
jgi:hypothetical protein